MIPITFVERIRAEIIQQNLEIYRGLFEKTDPESTKDAYWKAVLTLYASLNSTQGDVLFKLVRQVMVDTTSNLLAVLDGAIFLEGQTQGLVLTLENQSERLNEGLQDLFLELEEEEFGSGQAK